MIRLIVITILWSYVVIVHAQSGQVNREKLCFSDSSRVLASNECCIGITAHRYRCWDQQAISHASAITYEWVYTPYKKEYYTNIRLQFKTFRYNNDTYYILLDQKYAQNIVGYIYNQQEFNKLIAMINDDRYHKDNDSIKYHVSSIKLESMFSIDISCTDGKCGDVYILDLCMAKINEGKYEPESFEIRKSIDLTTWFTLIQFLEPVNVNPRYVPPAQEYKYYETSIDNFSKLLDFSPVFNLKCAAPVIGEIVSNYNADKNHFGVDIATRETTPVRAITAGQVIFSGYDKIEGYIIGIYHIGKYVSFYKNTQRLTKRMGEYVFRGEIIAFTGNSAENYENTIGPHLHFELWQNGKPVNPEKYIKFMP